MAKQAFTGLFDNMPTVDETLANTAAKDTAAMQTFTPNETQDDGDRLPERENVNHTEPSITADIATVRENSAPAEETKPSHGALPFLKEQRSTEKKNQTFYIPVYLQERLKESAEMYHMTVSGVLTEILKSVYHED